METPATWNGEGREERQERDGMRTMVADADVCVAESRVRFGGSVVVGGQGHEGGREGMGSLQRREVVAVVVLKSCVAVALGTENSHAHEENHGRVLLLDFHHESNLGAADADADVATDAKPTLWSYAPLTC